MSKRAPPRESAPLRDEGSEGPTPQDLTELRVLPHSLACESEVDPTQPLRWTAELLFEVGEAELGLDEIARAARDEGRGGVAAELARVEARLIGHGAWGQLAAYYRARASREEAPLSRADWLARLAELLEEELRDRAAAQEVWAKVAELTRGPPLPRAAQSASKTPRRRTVGRSRAAEWRDGMLRRADAPLDPSSYLALAELADRGGDGKRSALMKEIARALEGGTEDAPPVPNFTLHHQDWAALRHPHLRAAPAELLAIAGPVFCDLEARPPVELGLGRPFSMERSAGSRATGEALLAAVRVLGLRSPDVRMSAAQGPPLRPANTSPPQILVGLSAVKRKPQPADRLRFFAGRTLATFHPELAAARLVSVERLQHWLEKLGRALADEGPVPEALRELARKLPAKSHDRLAELLKVLERTGATATSLRQAARNTVDRAGMVVAGSVGAAVAALRSKADAAEEIEDLLGFASSEPYYRVRFRRAPILPA